MDRRELDYIKIKCPECGKYLTAKKTIKEADCPCCETALTFVDEEIPSAISKINKLLKIKK